MKDVRETTKKAFAQYEADNADYAKALTILTKLKGIGPATASLLLSCYDPTKVPFFSDELYRWLHWADAKSKGWDRKISYTAKEYKDLWQKMQDLRDRIEKNSGQVVKAIDAEKVAYVLGKEAKSSKRSFDDDSNKEALRPPSPKRRRKQTPPLDMDPVSVCQRKGPRGSPTYNKLGYELDYDYVAKVSRIRSRPSLKQLEKRMDATDKKNARKVEMMGMSEKQRELHEPAWDDRVARDLGIAFHEVGVEEYEEWHKRGFKASAEDFKDPSEEEKERLFGLSRGCALRKGSKH